MIKFIKREKIKINSTVISNFKEILLNLNKYKKKNINHYSLSINIFSCTTVLFSLIFIFIFNIFKNIEINSTWTAINFQV